MGRKARRPAVGIILPLFLAACSDGTNASSKHADSAPLVTEVEPGLATKPTEPAQSPARDPLAEAALRAQQAILESHAAEAEIIANEHDALTAIQVRIVLRFRDAFTDLKGAGVAFDQAQAAVNILNVNRRRQGVFELETTSRDPSDQFRIVDDFFSGPFGVVLLHGTNHPQSFKGWVRGDVLGPDGRVSEQCRVAVPSGLEEILLECHSVIEGRDDVTLINLAKAYLVSEMQ